MNNDSCTCENNSDIQNVQNPVFECPIGFESFNTGNIHACICSLHLLPYITNCDLQTETLFREGDFWITYIHGTNNYSSGYVTHPNCPLNYCYPPTMVVKINLNTPNGSDAQCNMHRSGTLCGSCRPGFSLSLGSSRCLVCSSHWSDVLGAIIIAGVVAGIVLVALMLVLNLTVRVGTLNGIIFYANILNTTVTYVTFPKPNFMTVFISWVNVRLGLDTCFYEGMEAYGKTWLQLIFPVGLVITFTILAAIVSFTRIARFIRTEKEDLLATLATLILFGYGSILQFITESFIFTMLVFPGGSVEPVWLLDSTVRYLRGKHIALFVAALLLLSGAIVFGLLLLFWQWLVRLENRKYFTWLKNQTLRQFIDTFHAPYVSQHRYWMGTLLLIRVGMCLLTVFTLSSDPRIVLLAICIVTAFLMILRGTIGIRIYKEWLPEILEMTCYLNLNFFCLMGLFAMDGSTIQIVAAYISGAITLVSVVIVILYHVYTRFKPHFEKIINHSSTTDNGNNSARRQVSLINGAAFADPDDPDTIAMRSVTIIGKPPPELPLSALIESGSVDGHKGETFTAVNRDLHQPLVEANNLY